MKNLSSKITLELTWFTPYQLMKLLVDLEDNFNGDRFDMVKHISKKYTDKELEPFLDKYISK